MIDMCVVGIVVESGGDGWGWGHSNRVWGDCYVCG